MTNEIQADPTPSMRQNSVATIVVMIALCLYWCALFYGTHTKLPPGILPGNSDKLVHFAAFAGLGVLLMTLRATRGQFPWYSVIARWIVLAFYGAFDELSQMFVGRTTDFYDWTADIIGAFAGLILVTLVSWCIRGPR